LFAVLFFLLPEIIKFVNNNKFIASVIVFECGIPASNITLESIEVEKNVNHRKRGYAG